MVNYSFAGIHNLVRVYLLGLCLFFTALPLWPQANGGEVPLRDPVDAIGLTLAMVYSQYGVPGSVYAVRGAEEWQDDVVFVYDEWDLYVYKDRVWQVGVKSAQGIRLGDPSGVISLLLGEGVIAYNGYMLYTLPSRAWPLQMRFDLDTAGKVTAIFIYRSDF
ncbi:hypothetical protein AGMMS49940_17510 [Spirochaetia bacterium]|nr:hypothetical protein AGMMS49940_17510 [Spirochaetia bacterium]